MKVYINFCFQWIRVVKHISSIEKAIEIINDNFSGNKGSLLAELNDKCIFSKEKFWELYDSIMIIVLEHYYDEEITNHISWCYQQFLKEFIYHFSIEDSAVIEGFPDNYNGYIERFEYAIQALYSKSETGIAEDLFELQRDV